MSEDAVRIVVQDGEDPPRRWRPPAWLPIVLVVVLTGIAVMWTAVRQDSTPATLDTNPASSSAGTSLAIVPSTTVALTKPVPSTVDEPITFTDASVVPLLNATGLMGEVALTPVPGGPSHGTLWVLRPGGSIVSRNDVPLWPRDVQYPMLMTGGNIVFTNHSNAYVIDAGLEDEAEPLTDWSFVESGGNLSLVPGGVRGFVWLVGANSNWVAPIDVDSREIAERIDVSDELVSVLAGSGFGLIVVPGDETAYGANAYWHPGEGLSLALPLSSQSGVHVVSGNVAVVISPGRLAVIDMVTGDLLSSVGLGALGEGLVGEVCISPDQNHVAVVGSTGEAFIMATDTGTILHRLSGVHANNSIGWTDPSQFVFIADSTDGASVQALNIATGQTERVAALGGFPTFWWLAASGTMC